MKVSQLFGKTLRQEPTEAETVSHRLLLKAGMIQQLASGVYSYLPLAWRALRKIEQILREEMEEAGAQEVRLPALHPLEMWQESGRAQAFGENLFALKDRREHDLCLAPTHEEAITDLVRHHASSYRDLPLILYQIQTKFRDEPRPRGGLLRVREFDMKDAYSFDADEEGLDRSYQTMVQAYKNIFTRCDLPFLMVEADSGAIGGKDSNEFILISDSGEDLIIYCEKCGYAANVEKGSSVKPKRDLEEPLSLEKVFTPNTTSIEALSDLLNVPKNRLLKAVVYWAIYSKAPEVSNEPVLVFIEGDLEVNEIKLKNLLKASELRPAADEEVKGATIPHPGFIGPTYLNGTKIHGVNIIVDDSVSTGYNWIAGANEKDHHLKNVNFPRDFTPDVIIADVAKAQAGEGCPKCSQPLKGARGIEVGHVFKLGTFFTEKLGAYYLDKNSTQKPIIMGCYGIGVGRLLAAAIEQNHDERGIIFPMSIAPFQVYLCALNMDDPQVADAAQKLYQRLSKKGIEVLFDDRLESAGVKFNDADLLGLPIRLTISPRTLKRGNVEIKKRKEKESQLLPISDAEEGLLDIIRNYQNP